jgi:hypothetical protein
VQLICIVIKLAFSRATDGYTKLDLMDRSEVEAFFKDNKVDGELCIALCGSKWPRSITELTV